MRTFFGYGLVFAEQARDYATAVCDVLGGGSNNSAVALLLETAAQETHLGRYRDPTPNGAGRGLCQCDEIPFYDVIKRSRPADVLAVKEAFGIDLSTATHAQLDYSPLLAMVICRLFYKLIPDVIPADMHGRAIYWKKKYNTYLGKGTINEYIQNAKRFL